MVRTYILAPGFYYKPDTSIRLGDIIQNPDDPTRILSRIPEGTQAPTSSHVETENKLSSAETGSFHGDVFAKFFNLVSAAIGRGKKSETEVKYAIQSLETVYYTTQVTDEEAAERIKNKKVQAALSFCPFWRRRVYMVTGLKIARGFQREEREASSRSAGLGMSAGVATPVGIGMNLAGTGGSGTQQVSQSSDAFVFAYQLHIIRPRSNNDAEISPHTPMGALLGINNADGQESEVELQELTEAVVSRLDEGIEVEATEAHDSHGSIQYLVLN